jgi:hypothetical protein
VVVLVTALKVMAVGLLRVVATALPVLPGGIYVMVLRADADAELRPAILPEVLLTLAVTVDVLDTG